jgi:hypothetical protein
MSEAGDYGLHCDMIDVVPGAHGQGEEYPCQSEARYRLGPNWVVCEKCLEGLHRREEIDDTSSAVPLVRAGTDEVRAEPDGEGGWRVVVSSQGRWHAKLDFASKENAKRCAREMADELGLQLEELT